MRPQKANQILSRAFSKSWYSVEPYLYDDLFTPKARLAAIKLFEKSLQHNIKLDNDVELAKRLNVIIPETSDYKHARTLYELNHEKTKIVDPFHADYASELRRLSYISDRYNCDHRLAYIIWVQQEFCADELRYRKEQQQEVENSGFKPKPVIHEYQTEIYKKTYDNYGAFEQNPESKIELLKMLSGSKIKRYGKAQKRSTRFFQTEQGVFLQYRAKTYHYREYNNHLLEDDIAFSSSGETVISLKRDWYCKQGTSRFKK